MAESTDVWKAALDQIRKLDKDSKQYKHKEKVDEIVCTTYAEEITAELRNRRGKNKDEMKKQLITRYKNTLLKKTRKIKGAPAGRPRAIPPEVLQSVLIEIKNNARTNSAVLKKEK